MTLQRPDTVILFDLDGTLIQGPFEIGVFPAVLKELKQKTGLEHEALLTLLERECDERQANPDVPAVVAMDWDNIVEAVAAQLGVTLEARVIELARTYGAPPHSYVRDRGYEVLQQLAAESRALVVATKGLAKYQRPVLDALGLTPLFSDILTPDKHHALKKDRAYWGDWPEISRLRIMVGDRYDDDVLAPHSFGLRTVWKLPGQRAALQGYDPLERPLHCVYPAGSPVRADAIIFSLEELPQVVRRLEQQLD